MAAAAAVEILSELCARAIRAGRMAGGSHGDERREAERGEQKKKTISRKIGVKLSKT